MAFSAAHISRLGLGGGPRPPYGSFAGKAPSPPVFTGTIADISVVENTGTYTYDLSTYFSGATSYSILPAIEAGWTFNTATAELVIDTDDANSFGPFTVTGTNTGGSAASNAFNVSVLTSNIWSDATTNSSIWAVQNPTATTWDGGLTTWDFEGNVETTSWDGVDDVWTDETTNPITWTDV